MKNSVYRLTISHHIWLVAITPVCQLTNAFSIIFEEVFIHFALLLMMYMYMKKISSMINRKCEI